MTELRAVSLTPRERFEAEKAAAYERGRTEGADAGKLEERARIDEVITAAVTKAVQAALTPAHEQALHRSEAHGFWRGGTFGGLGGIMVGSILAFALTWLVTNASFDAAGRYQVQRDVVSTLGEAAGLQSH